MKFSLKGITMSVALATAAQAATAVTLTPIRTGTFSYGSTSIGVFAGEHVSYDPGASTITYSQQPSFGFNTGTIGFSGFAIFDLAKLAGTVTAGTLQGDVGGALDGPPFGPSISFTFHESAIAPSAFDVAYNECTQGQPFCGAAFGGPGTNIYNSLPSGTVVGAVGVSGTGAALAPLNGDGVQYLQSGLGGKLVFGISFDGFGSNITLSNLRLTLDGVSAVPIPASWLLLAPLLGLVTRKRNAAA